MRHAVVNHNPFLGRVTMDALSVYENGEAQRVFSFPFERDDTWTFTLFAQDWTATTTLVDRGVATVVATLMMAMTSATPWTAASAFFVT